MSEELKTLKDIGSDISDDTLGFYNQAKQDIKAEAIKRVKYYRYKAKQKGLTPIDRTGWYSKAEAIIEFHNLTEEDLKNG